MPEADSHDTFEFASTLDDQAAFLRYASRRPYTLTFQAATYAFLWVSFFAMQLAIGLLGALFSAQHGLGEAMRSYLTGEFRDDLSTTAPIFTAFIAFLMLLSYFVLIPRQCRLLATKLMSGYPAPPGQGGPTILATRLHLSDKGAESVSDHERGFVAWPLVRTLVETRRHFFVMTSRATGLVISKSSLGVASTDRLREAIGRRLVASRPR